MSIKNNNTQMKKLIPFLWKSLARDTPFYIITYGSGYPPILKPKVLLIFYELAFILDI
jgi:hypothetical protein